MRVLNESGRTCYDPDDLTAFDGPPKYDLIEGPLVIHRFKASRHFVDYCPLEAKIGRWWYAKKLLSELKEDYIDATLHNDRHSDLTGCMRDGLAVRRDWNKFQRVITMKLEKGDALHSWTGLAKSQPEWTALPDGRVLGGGFLQYLIYDLWKAPNEIFTEQTLVSLCCDWGKMISGVHIR